MLPFLLRASITLGMLTAAWTAAGGRAAAQDAPEASAASYLFVQSAGGGTLEPIAAATGQYRLSLTTVLPSVVYFSDRPVRRVGHGSIQTLVDNWAMGTDSFAADPPNAALDLLDGPAPNVIVLELHEPAYDPATQTMTYRVVILSSSQRPGLADLVSRAAPAAAIPSRFGTAALFIDAGCSPWDPRC